MSGQGQVDHVRTRTSWPCRDKDKLTMSGQGQIDHVGTRKSWPCRNKDKLTMSGQGQVDHVRTRTNWPYRDKDKLTMSGQGHVDRVIMLSSLSPNRQWGHRVPSSSSDRRKPFWFREYISSDLSSKRPKSSLPIEFLSSCWRPCRRIPAPPVFLPHIPKRLGPVLCFPPLSTVWHWAHLWTKSFLPFSASPIVVIGVVVAFVVFINL